MRFKFRLKFPLYLEGVVAGDLDDFVKSSKHEGGIGSYTSSTNDKETLDYMILKYPNTIAVLDED